MKHTRGTVLLGLAIVLLGGIVGPPSVQGDTSAPTLAVGDQWQYSYQTTVEGLAMQGTMTQRITLEESVSVGSNTYDAFRASFSGSGTASASGLSGTWTMSGSGHLRRSDLADIRGNLTIVISMGFTVTVSVATSSTPPLKHYDFPLSVGKVWTETTTTVADVRVTSSLGYNSHNVTTDTNTHTYTVLRTEKVSVSAGAFDTLVISRSSSSGSSQEDYYSAQVGNSVKASTVDTGTATTLSLLEYTHWPYKTSLDVTSGGRTLGVVLASNVEASGLRHDSTSITFDVSGEAGLTGKAMISIPKGLNNTAIRVYVDSNPISSVTSQDAANYHLTFTFSLSTHTISVVYSAASRTPLLDAVTNPYVIGGMVGVAVVAVATLLLVTKRRKPAPVTPEPAGGEQGTGPAGPPPEAPPGESPHVAPEAPAPPQP